MSNQEVQLKAEIREDIGKKVGKKAGRTGKIPAVIYGKDFKNLNLMIDFKEFLKLRHHSAENVIVDLMIDSQKEPLKVLVHEIYVHPVSGEIQHVDFLHVDLKKKISTKVPIEYVGVSKAIKDLGGVLVKNIHEVEIEAFPTDIPEFIEAPLDILNEIGDHIFVKDLKFDKTKVLMQEDSEAAIASVTITKKEEVVAAPVAEATPAVGSEAAKAEDKSANTESAKK